METTKALIERLDRASHGTHPYLPQLRLKLRLDEARQRDLAEYRARARDRQPAPLKPRLSAGGKLYTPTELAEIWVPAIGAISRQPGHWLLDVDYATCLALDVLTFEAIT